MIIREERVGHTVYQIEAKTLRILKNAIIFFEYVQLSHCVIETQNLLTLFYPSDENSQRRDT